MPITRVILSSTSPSYFRYSILPSFITVSKVYDFQKHFKAFRSCRQNPVFDSYYSLDPCRTKDLNYSQLQSSFIFYFFLFFLIPDVRLFHTFLHFPPCICFPLFQCACTFCCDAYSFLTFFVFLFPPFYLLLLVRLHVLHVVLACLFRLFIFLFLCMRIFSYLLYSLFLHVCFFVRLFYLRVPPEGELVTKYSINSTGCRLF